MGNTYDVQNVLLQHVSDIVICLAKDFTITLLNVSGEKFYNWPNKEVIGKNFLLLCQSSSFTCPIHEHFFDDPSFLTINLDSKNYLGKQCNINWVICPLATRDNFVNGVMIIGKDMELKKNNIAYYLNGIINSIPGCLYWKDRNGRYLGCNELTAKLAGLSSPYEAVGKTDWQLWGERAGQLIKNDEQVITEGKILHVEEELKAADGRWIYFTGIKMPLRDENDRIIGLIGNSLDITELKKTQAELKNAKEQAEAANKAKTEFLENMRHDIRTPLTGIIGFANIIAEESKDPKIKEYVDNLNASSYALNDLLNEILEVIRVGSNEIPILKKKFSLKNKLSDVIRLTKAIAVQKNLQLSLDYDDQIPAFLIGDYTRIHRVVLELVTNALKFTNKGSVKLSAHLEKETERETILRLEVEDTGIGISPEQRQEVFLHFKRLTPSYEGIYKGAGLGLSIVKQFVDDLDGEIYVESLKEGGARFILILPLKKSLIQSELGMEIEPAASNMELKQNVARVEQLHNLEAENGIKKSHVLLVEDQAIAAKVVATLLAHLDCRVDHAVNGEAALKLFHENSYHLIFMDIGLPDLDGYEVTKRMRLFELNRTTHIPIIALTAHVDEENRQHCIDAGMNAVLSKPLTKEKATDILNAFIAHREQASSELLPSKDEQLLPQHQAINSAKLNELYAGKKEKINDVLRLVIESYPEDLATLEVAYTNKDLAALYFCVHKLKGGASYYAAELLVNYCSQLESAIKNKQEHLVSSLYDQVLVELQAAIKEAKDIVENS